MRILVLLVVMVVVASSGCEKSIKRKIANQAIGSLPGEKVDRGFHVVDGKIYYRDANAADEVMNFLVDGDAASLRTFPQSDDALARYAADANRVYMALQYQVSNLQRADARTFKLLTPDGLFSADAKHVYYVGVPLPDADPKTFQVRGGCFGSDAQRAYVGMIPLAVDIATWKPLGKGSAGDPWYRSDSERRPQTADELSSTGWSGDSTQVFFGHTPLADIDAKSFVALNDVYGKDRDHVFYFGEVVPGADAATFVVHPGTPVARGKAVIHFGPDAHDAAHAYSRGRVDTRPTPATGAQAQPPANGTKKSAK